MGTRDFISVPMPWARETSLRVTDVCHTRSGDCLQYHHRRRRPETKDIAADLRFYSSTLPPSATLTNISAGPNIYSDVDI